MSKIIHISDVDAPDMPNWQSWLHGWLRAKWSSEDLRKGIPFGISGLSDEEVVSRFAPYFEGGWIIWGIVGDAVTANARKAGYVRFFFPHPTNEVPPI